MTHVPTFGRRALLAGAALPVDDWRDPDGILWSIRAPRLALGLLCGGAVIDSLLATEHDGWLGALLPQITTMAPWQPGPDGAKQQVDNVKPRQHLLVRRTGE